MTFSFDLYFNSGQPNAVHYQKGDKVSHIEITNSDQDYYQHGVIKLFDVTAQNIGDTVQLYINGELEFDGYVARRKRDMKYGKIGHEYQVVGKTYDLWRYPTDDNAIYSGQTAYIASSLVSTYCENITAPDVSVTDGVYTSEIDLTNKTVGDALVALTELDGYRFYVDNQNHLQYYYPEKRDYDFIITDDDIVDMTPVEEADEDIINDVIVIGGSDYSKKAKLATKHPSSAVFPSGVLVAQQFTADDNRLSAVKLYLARSSGDNKPDSLNFEIWGNTYGLVFSDDFNNYNNILSSSNVWVDNGYLLLTPSSQEVLESEWNTGYYDYFYWGQTFTPTKDIVPYRAAFKLRKLESWGGPNPLNIHFEIKDTIPGTHQPTGNALTSGSGHLYADGWRWVDAYFNSQCTLLSGQTYALLAWCTDGDIKVRIQNAWGLPRGKRLYSLDGINWVEKTGDHLFWLSGNTYYKTGSADSNIVSKNARYLKVIMEGVSSNSIYISGTNDGNTWKSMPNDEWVDFGSVSSNLQLKYYLSSNGYFTPKIDKIELYASQRAGGIGVIKSDDFDDLSMMSSNTNNHMTTYNSKLCLDGTDGLWREVRPSSVSCSISDWSNLDYIIDSAGDDTRAILDTAPSKIYYEEFTFEFSSLKYISGISYLHFELQAVHAGDGRELLDSFYVSSEYTNGWVEVGVEPNPDGNWEIYYKGRWGVPPTYYYGPWKLEQYCKAKKVKLKLVREEYYDNGRYDNAYFYDFKIRTVPSFYSSGSIKTSSMSAGDLGGDSLKYLKILPTDVEYPHLIKYSGSTDGGLHWTSLTPGEFVEIPYPGNNVVVWYNFESSGESYNVTGSTLSPVSPSIGSIEINASTTPGGVSGFPDSTNKIEWSDDISWMATDIPYPPSWSGWKTYSEPKLQLEKGSYYWMIFNYPSSNGKWWKYYYDPSLTPTMLYSFNNGYTWSSNADYPSVVPKGAITYQLGWKAGTIRARASNQTSIDIYGRHFKIIQDSNITTEEQALARANAIVSGSYKVPKKGTITIEGRTDIETYYRFSSNLSYLGINDVWDIVSYTQRIDKNGFTTTINYGKHPYDIARKVAQLESEVYG